MATEPLRLVCISDTHGFHRKLEFPPGDILIHAGDFDGRTLEQIDDFNAWLGTLPFRHKLVIAGNHNLLFDRDPKLARTHLIQATYLQDSGVTLEGLNLWGSPANSILGEEWAFGRERLVKLRQHWDRIPDSTDVLVTHEPPYGTLDKIDILAKHRGCQYLLGALLRVKPKLHILATSMAATAGRRPGTRPWSTARWSTINVSLPIRPPWSSLCAEIYRFRPSVLWRGCLLRQAGPVQAGDRSC